MNETPIDLSVVITSYDTREYLRDCLRSIADSAGIESYEVWVVDNDSRDGSPEMVRDEFPWVHLLVNSENLGFARANNLALSRTRGRYVLLLNPDTRLRSGTLAEMIELMESRPEVGLAGIKLLREDGAMDRACRRGFPTPWNSLGRFLHLDRLFPRSRLFGGYNLTFADPDGEYEVDAIVGAFMFFRREVLEEVGLLDESFFMFGEDLDWCYRVRARDWKVLYVGSKDILHVKGASVRKNQAQMNSHFHRAMLIFHRKHLEQRYPFFVNWLVSCGIGLRWLFKWCLIHIRRRPRTAGPGRGPGTLAE
ncbi:MAG: glycosyltransferase family 2 protein [Planctomycetes bacterium]|nr:glycosyltransferase family 2 protein [Planctomycetota bacterium]